MLGQEDLAGFAERVEDDDESGEPLPLCVLGHEGSTVIVGLNGLRLLRAAAWRKALTGSTSPH